MSDIRFNLFRFAKSELSHSAFWAWVLQNLDGDPPTSQAAVREAAMRLMKRIGVVDVRPPVRVRTEVKIRGSRDRLDIVLEDSSGLSVIIENKVSTLMTSEQLERYAAQVSDRTATSHFVLISTAFDVAETVPDAWTAISSDDLLEIVSPDRSSHPLLEQYASWLEFLIGTRKFHAEDAWSEDPERLLRGLSTAEGQWSLMSGLTETMNGRQYRGINQGGAPWTQFMFTPRERIDKDALFYRIDVSTKGPYISLRQYQCAPAPDLSAKKARLEQLRRWWNGALRDSNVPLLAERPRNAGNKESEIGWFLINRNPPNTLREHLKAAHGKFVRRLAAASWPLMSDRNVGRPELPGENTRT